MKVIVLFVMIVVSSAFAMAPSSYPCPYDGNGAFLQGCQYGTQADICTYSHPTSDNGKFITHTFTVMVPHD